MSGRRSNQSATRNGAHRNGSVTNTPNNMHVSTSIRYMECQRNQAVVVGGFAVDGCREFMATGEEGTAEALICAACNCHRSFHRRVEEYQVLHISPGASATSQQNGSRLASEQGHVLHHGLVAKGSHGKIRYMNNMC